MNLPASQRRFSGHRTRPTVTFQALAGAGQALPGQFDGIMECPRMGYMQRTGSNSKDSVRDALRDVRLILWSIRLHGVRRYYRQRHWEKEAIEEDFCERVSPTPRLESVSEHSWHVADIVLTLGPRFAQVDYLRATELAILHDKLELITGDKNPIGRDGTGQKSHAFDLLAREKKDSDEAVALEKYLLRLQPSLQSHQRKAFSELAAGKSAESKFVKAIDKLQTLAYIHWKKDGDLSDTHLIFTVRYAKKATNYFPDLDLHLSVLLKIFLKKVAQRRTITTASLRDFLVSADSQLDLFRF